MFIKRIIPVVAISAMVGATACERQEETRIETPAAEAPVTTPAPTVEPAPTMQDTVMMHDDTLMHDTVPADTL